MKLLTWNVNSSEDPYGISYMTEQRWEYIMTAIKRENPDILCLQEVHPDFKAYVESCGYTTLGHITTHCDEACLFVNAEAVASNRLQVNNTCPHHQSAGVFGELQFGSKKVCIGSMHLAPFKDNGPARQRQLVAALSMAVDNGSVPILAGDMNIREPEAKQFLLSDLVKSHPIRDAWNGEAMARFSWDTNRNHYYGPEGFGFRARFDRVFVGTGVKVDSYKLVGDEPVRGTYLSDHFGICVTFHVDN